MFDASKWPNANRMKFTETFTLNSWQKVQEGGRNLKQTVPSGSNQRRSDHQNRTDILADNRSLHICWLIVKKWKDIESTEMPKILQVPNTFIHYSFRGFGLFYIYFSHLSVIDLPSLDWHKQTDVLWCHIPPVNVLIMVWPLLQACLIEARLDPSPGFLKFPSRHIFKWLIFYGFPTLKRF